MPPLEQVGHQRCPKKNMEPIRIFISYAHANAIWLRKTVKDRSGAVELNPRDLLTYWRNGLRRDAAVEFWYDRDEQEGLHGGDLWEKRVFAEIDRADVAVLLITQEFVDSEFIRDKELPRIAQRARRGEMELVPVLVEPARWEELELASFQLTPGRPTPLSEYEAQHEHNFKKAKLEVLDSLKTKVGGARQRREAGMARNRPSVGLPSAQLRPVSHDLQSMPAQHGPANVAAMPKIAAVSAVSPPMTPPVSASEPAAAYRKGDTKPTVSRLPTIGRNDPCPCGSGKKYKRCHGSV